ncbi:MAG TPA: DUF1800 domain-containing protein [Acidimicrobiales bacterium]
MSEPATLDRRKAIGALAGGAAAVTALIVVDRRDHHGPLFEPRDRASRPVDAGFANQDDSYAAASGEIAAPAVEAETLLFATAGEAAAGTQVTVPTILRTDDPVLHLTRRATFGPTPDLVAEVHDLGIDGWLAQQLDPGALPDPVADQAWAAFPLASADPPAVRAAVPRFGWTAMIDYGQAALARQVWSRRQLFEVMVDFWANHLNVPTPGPGAWDVASTWHNDVIRAHALGSFSDMLVAAMQHPAMLRYLSANASTREAVNENLGRELLELHTVGVSAGYTEDDVRNSAYILTGRTVSDEGRMMGMGQESEFVYDPNKHWTGPVKVLDFTHENATADIGMEVGDAYLRYLAGHPSTAQSIARKLAVRMVSDVPPQPLVDRLAQAYLDSGTSVGALLDTLFRSAEFWAAVGQKTRRPLENVVASARAVGLQPGDDIRYGVAGLTNAALAAGHRPLGWPAPNGYPDVEAAWRSAGGLLTLWNHHRAVVGGWYEGLTYAEPLDMVAGMPTGTVGEFVDSMCQRFLFQGFHPGQQAALVGFLGGDAAASSERVGVQWKGFEVASLVLDSPYFMLR